MGKHSRMSYPQHEVFGAAQPDKPIDDESSQHHVSEPSIVVGLCAHRFGSMGYNRASVTSYDQ